MNRIKESLSQMPWILLKASEQTHKVKDVWLLGGNIWNCVHNESCDCWIMGQTLLQFVTLYFFGPCWIFSNIHKLANIAANAYVSLWWPLMGRRAHANKCEYYASPFRLLPFIFTGLSLCVYLHVGINGFSLANCGRVFFCWLVLCFSNQSLEAPRGNPFVVPSAGASFIMCPTHFSAECLQNISPGTTLPFAGRQNGLELRCKTFWVMEIIIYYFFLKDRFPELFFWCFSINV